MSTALPHEDLRIALRAAVAALEHVLPAQAPIRDFVHHNTLHGFQHLPFPEALAEARRLIGAKAWLAEDESRAALRAGRIDESDLRAAAAAMPQLAADDIIMDNGASRLRRIDVCLVALRHPVGPLASATLAWRIAERHALTRFDADVPADSRARLTGDSGSVAAALGDLWTACGEVLDLPGPWQPPAGDEPDPERLAALTPPAVEVGHSEADALWLTQRLRRDALARFDELAARVGVSWTLRDFLEHLSGEDTLDQVRDYLVRHIASHLDLGLAAWRNPDRARGFYTAWRASAAHKNTWAFNDLLEWDQHLERLPEDALDTVIQELALLGLPQERWAGYLERLALELPGWSGMFLWRHQHPGYAGADEPPIDMLDYLAVRLVLERIHAQRLCRRHWQIEASLSVLRGYFRRHPAEFLVREGIDSISLTPDTVVKTTKAVLELEQALGREPR